jgi:hypothetical protein
MSRLFDRLRMEKEQLGDSPQRNTEKPSRNGAESMQSLLGNIREWLKDGEKSGLLQIRQNRVQVRDESAGAYEADGMGVDFGCGRILEVEPVAGLGSCDRVAMRFLGCRKTGNIQLQHRDDRWLIWPKNSVRQQPVPWSSKSFLQLLEDMI